MCFLQVIIYHRSLLAVASSLQTEPGGLQKPCKPSQIHSSGHHTITKGQIAAPYKKRDSTQFCNWLEFTNLSQLLRQNLRLGRVPLAHATSHVPRSWLGCRLSQLLPPAWHKATHPTSCPCCRALQIIRSTQWHWKCIKLSYSLCIISIKLLYKYNTSPFMNSQLLLLCLFDNKVQSLNAMHQRMINCYRSSPAHWRPESKSKQFLPENEI